MKHLLLTVRQGVLGDYERGIMKSVKLSRDRMSDEMMAGALKPLKGSEAMRAVVDLVEQEFALVLNDAMAEGLTDISLRERVSEMRGIMAVRGRLAEYTGEVE